MPPRSRGEAEGQFFSLLLLPSGRRIRLGPGCLPTAARGFSPLPAPQLVHGTEHAGGADTHCLMPPRSHGSVDRRRRRRLLRGLDTPDGDRPPRAKRRRGAHALMSMPPRSRGEALGQYVCRLLLPLSSTAVVWKGHTAPADRRSMTSSTAGSLHGGARWLNGEHGLLPSRPMGVLHSTRSRVDSWDGLAVTGGDRARTQGGLWKSPN